MKQRVLVFDSGFGGLTVAAAIRQAAPGFELVYAADNAAFPYGDWREKPLVRRMLQIMERLIADVQPDCVVIACNTASTLAIAQLREAFKMTFVGTVPAIKPAAAQTKSGVIGVLATPGTIKRDYTKTLIHTYAYHCRVHLYGAPKLAELAEQKLRGLPVSLEILRGQIGRVFRETQGKRTDMVVLGCTHYPLLLQEMKQAAPWPVTFIDPSNAIARRVLDVIPAPKERQDVIAADSVILTAALKDEAAVLSAYRRHGFDHMLHLEVTT